MLYLIDQGQLLHVWSVIRCFREIQEMKDPEIQSKILTMAQILLTGFVLELQPLPTDQASSAMLRRGGDQITRLDG